MSRYDRAVTVFSPDGQLIQVQYAQEAVGKGSPAVGVRGPSVVVLAVEKRTVEKLQDYRTERKIAVLDDHVILAFAGLRADARVLISRAQIECQSYRLQVEDPISIEYITRYLAEMKQNYTQSNGRRPFGISCLIAGFNYDGVPHLFQTEPSGIYYEWKASSTGRHEKSVREYLEKHYNPQTVATDDGAIKLAIGALIKAGQTEHKNLDVTVMKNKQPVIMMDCETIASYVSDIKTDDEEEAKSKQNK